MTDRERILEVLIEHAWLKVADYAWRKYQEHGRGVVLVDPDQLGTLTYATGQMTADLAANYDPRAQVVLAIPLEGSLPEVRQGQALLRGKYAWRVARKDPPPPEAFRQLSS